MAGTTTTTVKQFAKDTDVAQLVENFNKLVDDVEAVRGAVALAMPGVLTSDPALKTGTTSAKTIRAEAFTFNFRGKAVSAAAVETAFTATTHDVAASKEAWFSLSVQSDGTTFTITKAADATIGTVILPIGPDNEVIVGYVGIVTGTSGFNATTDDLAVAGTIITALTFTDAPAVGTGSLTAAKIGDRLGAAITSY
jgi:hypothetical protein